MLEFGCQFASDTGGGGAYGEDKSDVMSTSMYWNDQHLHIVIFAERDNVSMGLLKETMLSWFCSKRYCIYEFAEKDTASMSFLKETMHPRVC